MDWAVTKCARALTVEDDVFYVCFVVLAAGCFLSDERAMLGFVSLNDRVCLDRKGNYATTTLGLSDVAFNVKPFFLLLKYSNFFLLLILVRMAGGKLKTQLGNKALYRKLFLRLLLEALS